MFIMGEKSYQTFIYIGFLAVAQGGCSSVCKDVGGESERPWFKSRLENDMICNGLIA